MLKEKLKFWILGVVTLIRVSDRVYAWTVVESPWIWSLNPSHKVPALHQPQSIVHFPVIRCLNGFLTSLIKKIYKKHLQCQHHETYLCHNCKINKFTASRLVCIPPGFLSCRDIGGSSCPSTAWFASPPSDWRCLSPSVSSHRCPRWAIPKWSLPKGTHVNHRLVACWNDSFLGR